MDTNSNSERLKLDPSNIHKNLEINGGLVGSEKIDFFDKECSKVAEHVFLGGDAVAKYKDILKQNGITHVLNCVGIVCPEYFKSNFVYQTLWLYDSPSEDITSILYDVFDYFEDVREQQGRAFVHCYQGVSRSTSLVISYLMWREGQSFDDAFGYVTAARDITDPNIGFSCQLLQYQKRVRASPLSPSLLLRMYRFAPHSPYDPLHLTPKMLKDPSLSALDSRGAFIIHIPSSIYAWIGERSDKIMVRYDRGAVCQIVHYEKVQGPIITVMEGEEPLYFWDAFSNFLPLMDKLKNGGDAIESSSKVCPGERKMDMYNIDFEIFQIATLGSFVPPFASCETEHKTHLLVREISWSMLRGKFVSGNMKDFEVMGLSRENNLLQKCKVKDYPDEVSHPSILRWLAAKSNTRIKAVDFFNPPDNTNELARAIAIRSTVRQGLPNVEALHGQPTPVDPDASSMGVVDVGGSHTDAHSAYVDEIIYLAWASQLAYPDAYDVPDRIMHRNFYTNFKDRYKKLSCSAVASTMTSTWKARIINANHRYTTDDLSVATDRSSIGTNLNRRTYVATDNTLDVTASKLRALAMAVDNTLPGNLGPNHPLFFTPSDNSGAILISLQLTESENYFVWSHAMQIRILGWNKLGFIDGTCKKENYGLNLATLWERYNAIVLSWIMNRVSKELLSDIVYSSYTTAVGNKLKERFKKIDASIPRGYKFQPRGVSAIHMGYSQSTKEYILYNLLDKCFFISRDAIFREHVFPFSQPPSISWHIFSTFESYDDMFKPQAPPLTRVEYDIPPSVSQVPAPKVVSPIIPNVVLPTRQSQRCRRPLIWQKDYVTALVHSTAPYSIDEYVSYVHLSPVYQSFMEATSIELEQTSYEATC
ncbi:Protein-tyrosine-phosphatase MKP1 [Capsicum baccatum]|uniref:Protein-tyrosine-phosphatase MKP1 n=1 Tax=Capsicum baccatum TaxID=33114 RepID=A0A2G2WVC5_CAPBA|nr:Protein-tyrosine-phosphatase MKP1 [Capsicum baccatum]